MEHVILYRTHSGAVAFISNDDDQLEVFADRDQAITFAEESSLLNACLFQIVELDEL